MGVGKINRWFGFNGLMMEKSDNLRDLVGGRRPQVYGVLFWRIIRL